MNKKIVALDLDRTILKRGEKYNSDLEFEFHEGALEFLKELSDNYYIIIHTCRVSESFNDSIEKAKRKLTKQLDANGVKYDEIWDKRGKPYADLYVDDKAFFCNPESDKFVYDNVLDYLRII